MGRYDDSGRDEITLSGLIGDEKHRYTFDVDLADPGEGRRYEFVARLWAIRRIGDILDQVDLHGKNPELVDELVDLSRKYGILTPYTSFLADETTNLHAGVELMRRAGESLDYFSMQSGAAGVGQRANKGAYQLEDRASLAVVPQLAEPAASPAQLGQAATRPALAGKPTSSRFGAYDQRARGMASGMGGGMMGPSYAPGNVAVSRDLEGRQQAVQNVRNVGGKTFFLRDNTWVDSEIKPEEEASAKPITQFTNPYFALSRTLSPDQNQYLAFPDPVLVKLNNQVYRISQEAAESP